MIRPRVSLIRGKDVCSSFLAAGAAGKTAYILDRVRLAPAGDIVPVRVLVPTVLQALDCRRRLAEIGGSFGVQVQTFDQVYTDILLATRQAFTELSESVQYRLLQAIVMDFGTC